MPDGRGIDRVAAVEIADARQQVAEREHAFDRKVGEAKGRGDLRRFAALLDQPGEGFPLRDLIGIEPGDFLDERCLDGSGIVTAIEDRARQGFDVQASFAVFIGNDGAAWKRRAPATIS